MSMFSTTVSGRVQINLPGALVEIISHYEVNTLEAAVNDAFRVQVRFDQTTPVCIVQWEADQRSDAVTLYVPLTISQIVIKGADRFTAPDDLKALIRDMR